MEGIFYKDQGTGPVIILLHGFCETHQIWDGFAEELAKEFRVITPDLPGFGKSKLPPQPFSIADIGSQMVAWVSYLKIAKPVIIGHSLGGYIALAMAKINKSQFSGIGLFHSTAFADSEEKKANRNKTIDFVQKHGLEPFVESFVPSLFYQKNHPQIPFVKDLTGKTQINTFLGYTHAMKDRPTSENFIQNIGSYLLILSGIYDSIIPHQTSIEASLLAKNAIFKPLDDTGHMGMFESANDALSAIVDFRKYRI